MPRIQLKSRVSCHTSLPYSPKELVLIPNSVGESVEELLEVR